MFDLSSARIVDASSSQDSVVFTIHELHSLSEPLTFVVTLLAAQLWTLAVKTKSTQFVVEKLINLLMLTNHRFEKNYIFLFPLKSTSNAPKFVTMANKKHSKDLRDLSFWNIVKSQHVTLRSRHTPANSAPRLPSGWVETFKICSGNKHAPTMAHDILITWQKSQS